MDLTTGTTSTSTATTAVRQPTRVTVGQVAAPVVTSARTQARSPSTHRRASTPAERPTLQQTVLSPTAGGGTDTAVLGTPSVLYRKVVQARRVLGELAELTADERVAGGEITALTGLLAALEQGQVAAVALTDRIQRDSLAERSCGLPLEHLLALHTPNPTRHGAPSCMWRRRCGRCRIWPTHSATGPSPSHRSASSWPKPPR